VTSVALAFAAAVVAWGPVAPVPEPQPPDAADAGSAEEQAATAPAVGTGEVRPIVPAPAPPAATTPATAATPAPIQMPIIAKAPLDVRATPALVAAPSRQPDRPLYKHWLFWTIAGGFFLTTIVVTVVATRPGPQPYTGNAPPYYVPFQ
jgi:hypothetical protein